MSVSAFLPILAAVRSKAWMGLGRLVAGIAVSNPAVFIRCVDLCR
jgi:hypothetical protein